MTSQSHEILKKIVLVLIFGSIIYSCKKDELRREAKVTATTITEIKATTAKASGDIIDLGTGITDHGHCWGFAAKPTVSDSKTSLGAAVKTGIFVSNLQNLEPGKTYFIRAYVWAYATNSAGPGYGDELSFTTTGGGDTFTDSRDGNVYKKVTIGTQTWMAENLAWLPSVSPSSAGSEFTPYYYVYGYQGSTVSSAKAAANYDTYGVLYNWPAALTACPSGWHLPTDAEWTILIDYLTNNGYGYGGSGSDIGKSMASTFGWTSSSTAGTVGNDQTSNNRSGFTALPGGYRGYSGGFGDLGLSAIFWSSSEHDASGAWYRSLNYGSDGVSRYYDGKSYGFSARCLQN